MNQKLHEGYYSPFGIIFEVRDGVLYTINHNGKRITYRPGFCKKTDQAEVFLRRRPEMVFKGEDPRIKAQILDLKSYAAQRR